MSKRRSSREARRDPNFRDLLEELECPVCHEYMTPPISLCTGGHSICTTCRRKLKKCQICRKNLTKYRNLALEKIIVKLKYPCKYEYMGCTEVFSLDCLLSHQPDCSHRPVTCPYKVLEGKTCAWEGKAGAAVDHVITSHFV